MLMGMILALAWTFTPALAQEPKDPVEILQSYQAELLKAIKTTNDATMRPRLITAAKTVFTQEMRTAISKNPKPKWESHQGYMANLIVGEKKFGGEDNKNERVAWISACKIVFQFQVLHANEPAGDKVSTEDVFTELFSAIDKVRKDFPQAESADLRTPAYLGAKQVFLERLATAHAPSRNPQTVYTENLIKIDKAYPLPQAAPPPAPVTTPQKTGATSSGKSGKSGGGGTAPPPKEEYDFHTEPNTILKAGAKSAFDRSLVAAKQ
jgi:hypothetical protein